jgi:site-specific DNA-methyltransferase (adenine-specific)
MCGERSLARSPGGDHLRRDYEDLRRDYEDLRSEYESLRRPFAVSRDEQWEDVWEFPTVGAYEGKHPCEKPAALLEHIVRCSTRPGAIILDPFAGSGSTGVAALALGRQFVGIDSDPHWHRVASERCAAVAPKPDRYRPRARIVAPDMFATAPAPAPRPDD